MSHAADEAQPRQAMPAASASAARRRHSRRIPWTGIRRQTIVGWLFVLPALTMYALFVLQPLALTVQYSLYRWDGVGPGDVGRPVELRHRSQRAEARRDPVQRLSPRRVLQLHPGRPRAGDRERHPPRRVRSAGYGVADRPVPPAGHPAGRRRDHLGQAAVPERPDQPAAHGDRARRRHPRLAWRLRLRAAGSRPDRDLGPARVLHGAAAHRDDARSTARCSSRRASTERGGSRSSGSSPCPACDTRSACASPSR